jgi:hypothetical protein
MLQHVPKMGESDPQNRPTMAPRWARDAPKTAQNGPNIVFQDGSGKTRPRFMNMYQKPVCLQCFSNEQNQLYEHRNWKRVRSSELQGMRKLVSMCLNVSQCVSIGDVPIFLASIKALCSTTVSRRQSFGASPVTVLLHVHPAW